MKYRAQVTLNSDSALPKDVVVNTFHFDSDTGDNPTADAVTEIIEAEAQEIADRLNELYVNLSIILAGSLNGTGTIKVYNLSDPKPRPPLLEHPVTGLTLASASLPGELAVCLSFNAAYVAGVPKARRRGRVYFGPLSPIVLGTVAGGDIPINPSYVTYVKAFGEDLLGMNGNGITWAVYSPTTDVAGTLDEAFNDVVGGWVDNAFDVQRRRGHQATTRQTFAA